MLRVAFHNLGCKVNSYELEVMIRKMAENGYEIVPFEEKADIYIVNTCTVTAIADKKSRQMLHQARKRNPEAVVVAAGCYVHTGEKTLMEDLQVDLLVGNQDKGKIAELIEVYLNDRKKEAPADINLETAYPELYLEKTEEHTRATVKIQDGCNQFCSYCIIPYARGRIRSREKDDILREAKHLVESGYRELVVTGIHLSSYGLDLDGIKGIGDSEDFPFGRLLDVLRSLDELYREDGTGLQRIRLGSLEPRIITREFAQALKQIRGICPHFHLSLQSGCDETLKRMNRHYDTARFYEGMEILREAFDLPAITTDVITGFPGETEEEFAKTVAFLEKANFYEMHVFPYSVRKGTPAAAMKDQLTMAQKKERSDILLKMTEKQSDEYRRAHIGRELEILFEEDEMIGGRLMHTGYSREYIRCAFEGDAVPGEIRKITVDLHNSPNYAMMIR